MHLPDAGRVVPGVAQQARHLDRMALGHREISKHPVSPRRHPGEQRRRAGVHVGVVE
jgi:hypothetical protein